MGIMGLLNYSILNVHLKYKKVIEGNLIFFIILIFTFTQVLPIELKKVIVFSLQ